MPFPAVNVLGAGGGGGGFGFVELLERGVDDFDVEAFFAVVRTGAGAAELRGVVRGVVAAGRGVVLAGADALAFTTGFLVALVVGRGVGARVVVGAGVVVTAGPLVVLAPAAVVGPVRVASTSRAESREGARKLDHAVPPTTARVAATAAATRPRRTLSLIHI